MSQKNFSLTGVLHGTPCILSTVYCLYCKLKQLFLKYPVHLFAANIMKNLGVQSATSWILWTCQQRRKKKVNQEKNLNRRSQEGLRKLNVWKHQELQQGIWLTLQKQKIKILKLFLLLEELVKLNLNGKLVSKNQDYCELKRLWTIN